MFTTEEVAQLQAWLDVRPSPERMPADAPIEVGSSSGPTFTAEEVSELRSWLDIRPSPEPPPQASAEAGPSSAPPTGIRPPQDRPGQPPMTADRAHRLIQARELLISGMDVNTVNARLHVDKVVLRDVFDNNGRVRLSDRADDLLAWHEQQLVANLHDLPRALTHADTRTFSELLRRHAAEPFADLRQAAVEAGMARQAIDHLFDPAGWLRADRMDSLPDDQRQVLHRALELGTAQAIGLAKAGARLPRSRGGPPSDEVARAGLLAEAQAMLAKGESITRAAAHVQTDKSWLRKIMDKSGRLLLTPAGDRLKDCADPELAARFAAVPRALLPKDAHLLAQLLHQQAREPVDDLRAAASEAGVSPQAVDHLFDDDGVLRLAHVEALPPAQRSRLLDAAHPDGRAPESAAVEHARKLARARTLMSEGASRNDAADQLGLHPSVVKKVLDPFGHLLISLETRRLLRGPDPALAEHFAGLPRALRAGDLHILAALLREHGTGSINLRDAAVAADMGYDAVDYMFHPDGTLRQDRLSSLPVDQQRYLGGEPRWARPRPPARAHAATDTAAAPAPAPAPENSAAARARPRTKASASTGASSSGPQAPGRERQPASTRPAAAAADQPAQRAGRAEIAAVLQFFRQHPQPLQAFHQAQSKFELSREGLLQMLASAGVTELEAIGGHIPDAAQRWQRLRDNVRGESGASGTSAGHKRTADDAFGGPRPSDRSAR